MEYPSIASRAAVTTPKPASSDIMPAATISDGEMAQTGSVV